MRKTSSIKIKYEYFLPSLTFDSSHRTIDEANDFDVDEAIFSFIQNVKGNGFKLSHYIFLLMGKEPQTTEKGYLYKYIILFGVIINVNLGFQQDSVASRFWLQSRVKPCTLR